MRLRPPTPGFTLLEMLVVLVLIAAASLLAVSAFGGGLRGAQQRAAAKEVAAQLRFTRALAISTGQPQDFIIEPQARRWSVAGQRDGTLPEGGTIVFNGAREVQPTAQKGAIRFFPDGAATGGRVQLLANGAGWEVKVRWLTGEVRLARAQVAP